MSTTAFILAAGRGSRLQPLTNFIPKPLVQLGGKTLIQRHMQALAESGFTHVIINHAYLGQQIVDHCQAVYDQLQKPYELIFSAEPEGGLETAGGVVHALEHLPETEFTLINADVYTDFKLSQLTQCKLDQNTLGQLIMVPTPDYKDQHDFYFADDFTSDTFTNKHTQGPLLSEAPETLTQADSGYTFAGISVLSPKLFLSLSSGKQALAPILRAAMQKQLIQGLVYRGEWHDVGTIERLKQLRAHLNTDSQPPANQST